VSRRDGDATGLLLRGVVDGVEGPDGDLRVVLGQDLGDSGRQRRLPVVDVPDGADVDVRLRPVELLLRHVSLSLLTNVFVCLFLVWAAAPTSAREAARLQFINYFATPCTFAITSSAMLRGAAS